MPAFTKNTEEKTTVTSATKANSFGNGQSVSPPAYQVNVADGQMIQMKAKEEEEELKKKLPIQTKLKMGQPGDKYEQEADTIAEKVVRANPNDYPLSKNITPLVLGKGEGVFDHAPSEIERKLKAPHSGGFPLPEHTRLQMEQAFGADFRSVRIHEDSEAVKMNETLKSQAFTFGFDIYFNSGAYRPGTRAGDLLMAHEGAHALQQKKNVQLVNFNNYPEIIQMAGNEELSKTINPSDPSLRRVNPIHSPSLEKAKANLRAGRIEPVQIFETNLGAGNVKIVVDGVHRVQAAIELEINKLPYESASETALKQELIRRGNPMSFDEMLQKAERFDRETQDSTFKSVERANKVETLEEKRKRLSSKRADFKKKQEAKLEQDRLTQESYREGSRALNKKILGRSLEREKLIDNIFQGYKPFHNPKTNKPFASDDEIAKFLGIEKRPDRLLQKIGAPNEFLLCDSKGTSLEIKVIEQLKSGQKGLLKEFPSAKVRFAILMDAGTNPNNLGSGFSISKDGYLQHSLERSGETKVELVKINGEPIEVKILGEKTLKPKTTLKKKRRKLKNRKKKKRRKPKNRKKQGPGERMRRKSKPGPKKDAPKVKARPESSMKEVPIAKPAYLRIIAAVSGAPLVLNEILAPYAAALVEQKKNIEIGRSQIDFWEYYEAEPKKGLWDRYKKKDVPLHFGEEYGFSSEHRFFYVKSINIEKVRSCLPERISNYNDLIEFLELGTSLWMIDIWPPISEDENYEEIIEGRRFYARFGVYQGNKYDITSTVLRIFRKTLKSPTLKPVEKSNSGFSKSIFRLKDGKNTEVYPLPEYDSFGTVSKLSKARVSKINNSHQLFGKTPLVYIPGNKGEIENLLESEQQIRVIPYNEDANKAARLAKYSIIGAPIMETGGASTIEYLYEYTLKNTGREILQVERRKHIHGHYLILSFIAGPDSQLKNPKVGITKYSKDNYIVRAVGEVYQFYIDPEALLFLRSE